MSIAPIELADPGTLAIPSHWLVRAADYGRLLKPRLTALAVFAALIGYLLASGGQIVLHSFFGLLTGAFLVGGGANALNQYLERHFDRLMKRTENRPLPSERIDPSEAHALGVLLGGGGVGLLMIYCGFLPALLAAITLVSYLCVYTPLKRSSAWCTLVGAVPGALPVLMGWSAFEGKLSLAAWGLFAVVGVWQLPHFWAICWLYRDDYRAGGFVLAPLSDASGRVTANQSMGLIAVLLPLSLALPQMGVGGWIYRIGAVIFGLGLMAFAIRFRRALTSESARSLFLATVAYLPLLMGVLLVDHLI